MCAQACEQIFSWVTSLGPQVRYMNKPHLLFYLTSMADTKNKELEKTLPAPPTDPTQWMPFAELWSGREAANPLYNKTVVRAHPARDKGANDMNMS
jgi:hypothetical protein